MADANVRVLISALTEAAQQSIEEVGDEMTGLSADGHIAAEGLDAASDEMSEATRTAAILQAALDEVGDEALDAAIDSELLQGRLDEVGDEAVQAAVQTQAASGAFSSLSASSSGASLSIGLLSTAFTLSLIPAVLTAATVLAPLVVVLGALAAGAVSLAGAFGLIIGSGMLAWGDQMAQQNQQELDQTKRLIKQYESMKEKQGALTAQQESRLRQLRQKKAELEDQTSVTGALAGVIGDLKEELKPLIVDFGREFIPLVKEAVQAIPDLVREIFGAIGGTGEFKDALREFGGIAAEVLPVIIGLMFDLARMALPALRDLISFLQDNGDQALSAMKESFQELKPELMDLLDALIDMAPVLLEFGTNVGEVLLPALTWLIEKSTGFMETVNDMSPLLRKITIAFIMLAPVILKIVSAASTLASLLGYEGLTGALSSLALWLTTTISGGAALGAIIGLIGVKILDMLGFFGAVGDAAKSFSKFFGEDLVDSLLVFLSVITLGIFPVLAALGGFILGLVRGDLSQAVDNVKQIMETFGDAFMNVGGIILDAFEWIADIIMGFIGNSIIPDMIMGGLSKIAQGFVDFFIHTLPSLVIDGLVLLMAGAELVLNSLLNLFGDTFNGIIQLVSDAMDQSINGLITMINQFLKGVDEVAGAVSKVIDRDIGDIGTLDKVNTSEISDDFFNQKRTTNWGELQQRNRGRTEGIQRQINNTNVNIDVGGDLQSDPYSFSRDLADQVTREERQNNGT